MQSLREHLNQCQEGTEINGHLDRQREQKTEMSVMLTEEDEHGIIEYVDIAERGFLSGLAFVMDNIKRQIPVLPTALQQAKREINA